MNVCKFRRLKDFQLRTTQIIGLGFLLMIFLGSVLLTLPMASKHGISSSYMDSLFTATTASCVTGLVTVVTGQYWSLFGQIVILVMIQLGGLGVVSFTTLLLVVANKRIRMKQRLLIQEAYGFDTLTGLVRMVKRMFKGTLIVEGVGAVFYALVFIPEYGILKGLWFSVFTSVSAFCNAGMDVMGTDSMMPYVNHPLMNMVTMALIILGGLGFMVWWDLIDGLKHIFRDKMRFSAAWRQLALHTKLVLTSTGILIIAGACFFFAAEYKNPLTIGNLPFSGKIWASFFQSVTLRTAGFVSVDQSGITAASALMGCILMFIGGSPGGTAGGVKTTTLFLMVFSVGSILGGKADVELGRRRISIKDVMKGLCVVLLQVTFLIMSALALCILEPGISLVAILYEVFSALNTVGISMGITGGLSLAAKMVLIASMYFGRLGPITVAMILNKGEKKGRPHRRLPDGKIYI